MHYHYHSQKKVKMNISPGKMFLNTVLPLSVFDQTNDQMRQRHGGITGGKGQGPPNEYGRKEHS